jgi:ABC-2 type transport system ATP-binding protein
MVREGHRIEVVGLTKRFGQVLALDDLTFSVRPGRVTGFLGPNGAGKTTTLRCLLGLVTPTAGSVTLDGRAYRDIENPLRTVGAALEAASFHPGRSARAHLQVMALAAGLPSHRVDEVLLQVGMTEFADRRVGGYSLGMRQRLALAQALLGDPPVLVLDEPANGLDPAGIAWLRQFLRALAHEGRTVVVSSHVLSEVQQTVDDVVVIHRGRLVSHGPMAGLVAGNGVRVRSPHAVDLHTALERGGADVQAEGELLHVRGRTAAEIGDLAFELGAPVHELAVEAASLEEVFFRLTSDSDGDAPA